VNCYCGPVRNTPIRKVLEQSLCVNCGRKLPKPAVERLEWFCLTCKDPSGWWTFHMLAASLEAKKRCAEAYPSTRAEQLEMFA